MKKFLSFLKKEISTRIIYKRALPFYPARSITVKIFKKPVGKKPKNKLIFVFYFFFIQNTNFHLKYFSLSPLRNGKEINFNTTTIKTKRENPTDGIVIVACGHDSFDFLMCVFLLFRHHYLQSSSSSDSVGGFSQTQENNKSKNGENFVSFFLYLFEVEGDGDPFKASTVLQRGTLPSAVGAVDHVGDGMTVLGVFIVAYLKRIKNTSNKLPKQKSRFLWDSQRFSRHSFTHSS